MSSPVLGSVTAKHIFSAPEMIGGIIRCCCSSVPNRITGSSPNTGPWIAEAAVMPPPLSATACIITAASVMPSPEPPTLSGMAMPSPAGVGHRLVELERELARAVVVEPVIVAELRAVLEHCLADVLLVFGEGEIHGSSPAGTAERLNRNAGR